MFKKRYYRPNKVYELVTRARQGIPFSPTQSVWELMQGIIACAMRGDFVELAHLVFMGNHLHAMLLPKTGEGLSDFDKDIKKRSTDALKVLLDYARLALWEKRSNVAHIPILRDNIRKIIYIYSNPASAGLVDSIDDYPGFNTWKLFLECEPDVNACIEIPVRYYYKRALTQLPRNHRLSVQEDQEFLAALREQPVQTGRVNIVSEEVLRIRPFAFLKAFGITDPKEVQKYKDEIITGVREREAELRAERAAAGKGVVGRARLANSQFMKPHTPKERKPRVSVICSDEEVKKSELAKERTVHDLCDEIRIKAIKAKADEVIVWPKHVFIPWLPPRNRDRDTGAAAAASATTVTTAPRAAAEAANKVAEVDPAQRE